MGSVRNFLARRGLHQQADNGRMPGNHGGEKAAIFPGVVQFRIFEKQVAAKHSYQMHHKLYMIRYCIGQTDTTLASAFRIALSYQADG